MRKDILMKKLARLQNKRSALATRAEGSTDAAEVRAINEEINELNEEINETDAEIKAIEEEERAAQQTAEVRSIPADAVKVNGTVVNSTHMGADNAQKREGVDSFATMEYRKAFMKYAQTGEAIPANLAQRDNAPANTDSLGATIPTTVMNEFINEVQKRYGNLYAKCRKLSVTGAVKFPIAKLQASFKWVTEGTVSPRQDGGEIKDFVEFSYNMAEIRVSQTLLSSIVSLDLFEREIVRIMTIAYMQAMDEGIVRGTGNGQMLGILNDSRITNVVEFSATEINDWTEWRKKFFAKLPLGYRAGEFIFPIETVDAYLETMADNNNNPIFRQATGLEVNDGDALNPNGRFFGRNISLVEPDILPDFDTASDGDVIGIYWQPEEYAINTNMAFGMRRWFDEERNEWVNKMLTIVDGKVLNPKGFVLIKKKA